MPQYNIKVWNRTDLSNPDPSNKLREVIYTLVPNAFVPNPPPGLPGAGNGWPQGAATSKVPPYRGEVIPPYACMRVAGAPLLYKDDLLWPVCLPDDDSQVGQLAAYHFFNGRRPIPFMARGLATQDERAPVLVDLTAGNSYTNPGAMLDMKKDPGLYKGELGIMCGSWALQPATNCINAGLSSTVPLTYWPYCSLGRMPSVNDQDPTNPFYSWFVFIVGRGGGCRISNPEGALAAAVNDMTTAIFGASI